MCRCHASVPCEVPPSTRRPRLRPRGPSLWALALCPCPCRWMSVADRLVVSGGSGVAVCCIVLGWCMRCVCPRVVGCRASVAHTTHAALNAVSGRTESVHTVQVGTALGGRLEPAPSSLVRCYVAVWLRRVCVRDRAISRVRMAFAQAFAAAVRVTRVSTPRRFAVYNHTYFRV